MSGSSHLTIHPERCNQCGRCVPSCPEGALKVGAGYIYVDEKRCTMCGACVEVCEPGAIGRSVTSTRSGGTVAAVALGDVPKVVVGSRAEAKALRKAALSAEKSRTKPTKQKSQPRRGLDAGTPPVRSRAAEGLSAGAADTGARTVATPSAKPKVAETRAPSAVESGGPPRGSVEWTPLDAAVLLGVLIATMLVKDWVLGLRAVSLMPDSGKTLVRAGVLTLYYCVQLGTLAWLAARHGSRTLAAFGLGRDGRAASTGGTTPAGDAYAAGSSAGLVLLLFVGTEAFAVAYNFAMQLVGLSQPPRLSSDLTAVFGGGGVGMALSVALVAVVAPLVEELAFRGVVQPVLGARLSPWPAIVLGAAIYAAFHLNLWLFVPTMVLGVALGWLAWTRRSLVPAIALHTLYNAAAVAASFALSHLVR